MERKPNKPHTRMIEAELSTPEQKKLFAEEIEAALKEGMIPVSMTLKASGLIVLKTPGPIVPLSPFHARMLAKGLIELADRAEKP